MPKRGRHCHICGKGRMQRNLVSHAVNTHVRYVRPNLRMIRALKGGRTLSMLVCAKCLKRGLVKIAPSRRASRSAKSAHAV